MTEETENAIPSEYTTPNVEQAERAQQQDNLPTRKKIFNNAEENLRQVYGDDPVDRSLWNVGERYADRREALENALRKMYYPGVEKPLDNHEILQSNDVLLTALALREHSTKLAFGLEDIAPEKEKNLSIFLQKTNDRAFCSPEKTAEGQAVTAIVRYIQEHAPELIALAKQTFPFTTESAPDDPNRRLFYERLVSLFSLKPPDEVRADHPNTRLWDEIFKGDRQTLLFRVQDNDPKEHYQELFNSWRESQPKK